MGTVYKIVLRNERAGRFRKSLGLIAGLNVIYFLFVAVRERSAQSLALSGLALLFTVLPYMIAKYKKPASTTSEPGVFALGAFMGLHMVSQQWWISLALLVIIILYTFAVKVPVLTVSEENVVLDGFPKKTIHWKELNNLLVKDGLLTIDFRNNHVIQQLVEGNVDEGEINGFCQEKIKAFDY